MRRLLRVEHLAPVLAGTVLVLALVSAARPPCSLSTPCGPYPVRWAAFGLLLAPAAMVYLHRWSAVWAQTACALAWIAVDRRTAGGLGPAVLLPWLSVVVLVFIARHGADAVEQVSPRRLPPPPGRLPPVARPALVLAAAVLVLAAGLGAWLNARQAAAERRQDAARVVTGTVREQITGRDGSTAIRVLLPGGGAVTPEVYAATDYPVGSRVRLWAGDHRLVSEPYDVTPWLVVPVVAAGVAVALLARAARRRRGLRRFFGTPQPVRAVRVVDQSGYVHVLLPLADGRGAVEFGIDVDGAPGQDPGEDPQTVPAVLYGEPRAGRWCAVEVDGRLRVPLAPVDGTAVVDYDAEHALPREVAEDDAQWVDRDALTEADRLAAAGEPREHRVAPVRAWFTTVGAGLGAALATAELLALTGWAHGPGFVVVAVAAALGYEVGWRTQVRPRLRWHAGGIAAVTFGGRHRAAWTPDSAVVHDDGSAVELVAGDAVLAVPVPQPWPSGSAQRTPAQLVAALRDARSRALVAGDVPAPPRIDAPRRPVALYAAWAATVAVAVVLF